MGQLGDLSPSGSIAIGVAVGLVSTSVQSLGLTLQRKSHILEDEKDEDAGRRPAHRRRRWQLGMLMFVVANLVGSTVQITTLPLPVLSTLQASGLVFNAVCASLILNEPFTQWTFGGTVLVSIGAVLIALFGAFKEPAHTLDELLDLLAGRPFIIWMILQGLLVITIIVAAKLMRLLSPRTRNTPRTRLLSGMAYGAVSGILSAHTLLLAKSAVELLVRTISDRVNQFDRYQSWLILLGLLTLALTQLYYLHRGLRLVSTSILYPFVFCIYNIIAILDGLIYFRQTSRLSILHACLIALGTVILLVGIFALSWGQLRDPDNIPATTAVTQQSALAPGLGFVDDISEDSFCPSAIASPLAISPIPSDDESECERDLPQPGPSSFHPSLILPHRSHTIADLESDHRRPGSHGTSRQHLLDRYQNRRRSSAAALASLMGRRLPRRVTVSNPTSPIATERTSLPSSPLPKRPKTHYDSGVGDNEWHRPRSPTGKGTPLSLHDLVGDEVDSGEVAFAGASRQVVDRKTDEISNAGGGEDWWGRRLWQGLFASHPSRSTAQREERDNAIREPLLRQDRRTEHGAD